MIDLIKKDRGQCDIIKKIMIITKRDNDTIQAVIMKKYQNYPSTTILKHANILAKVKKSPYVRLLNMMPYHAYSITIHVRTMTISNKRSKIRLSNEKKIKAQISSYYKYYLCAI